MRVLVLASLVGLLLLNGAVGASADWSWGDKEGVAPVAETADGDASGAAAAVPAGGSDGEPPSAVAATDLNADVIDDILRFGRQGRNLEGFDEVYADPNVQDALQSGNDTSARHYIKDRLCSLGLSSCDEDPARSVGDGYQPQDLIYAQPVHIKPVGTPIAALPIRNPHAIRPYGPPRPHGPPPPPVGPGPVYGRPPRPQHYGPPGPPSAVAPGPYYPGHKAPPPSYELPAGPVDAPYAFEGAMHGFNKKKGAYNVPDHIPSGSGVVAAGAQQHVHHHFHHADSTVASLAGGTAGIGGVGSGVVTGARPVYESASGLGGYGSSYAPAASSYSPASTGFTPGPVYPPNQAFYKKELNLKQPSANSLSGSAYGNRYAETGRAEGPDCFCVPVEQCPAHEILRKEDGNNYIDPRNAPSSDILADEVVVTDENGTIISPPSAQADAEEKSAPEDRKDDEGKKTEADAEAKDEDKKEEVKERRKRQTNNGNGSDSGPKGSTGVVDAQGESDSHTAASEDSNPSPNGRAISESEDEVAGRQAYYGNGFGAGAPGGRCGPRHVCCRRPARQGPVYRPQPQRAQCGRRQAQGINGRIKNPVYVDGDSEFGEYPWQVAILKKDPNESVYVCGGTLIDSVHIITAAHCVKSYTAQDLRVRLGEWDVNHDVEFYPHVERDVSAVVVHPEFYAGTLYNDLAIIRLVSAVDFSQSPHISPACLPDQYTEYAGSRCWTTGWGKDAFGDFGKYQNILKEVDVPVVSHQQCERQLQQTRLGYDFKLHQGFVCAGGEEGKDACKGDGGGPMVCERGGSWQVVGVVSWGVGCGQSGVPGVYVKVAHYLDWIRQVTNRF